METDKEKFEEMMRPLRQKYLAQVKERLAELEKYKTLKKWTSEERDYVISFAHKLSGSGKTYGFNEISLAARELEESLLAGSEDLSGSIDSLMSSMASALENIEQAGSVTGTGEETIATVEGNLPVILLIDDDPDIARLLQGVFTGKAAVRVVTSANAAMQILQSEKPDLIFLDDKMPGTTGLEMLEVLEEKGGAGTPVLMLTASSAPENVMRGLASGAVDYITKPFDPAVLVDKAMQRITRGKVSVLIADDDAPVRDLLAHKFKVAGWSVQAVSNGTEALESMKQKPPKLAILDRMMPGLDGLVVLQQMQDDENLSDIPVIFLTAKHQEADVLEGLNMGAADYIVKPFNPDEVVARCLRFIKKKKEG